MFGGFLVGLVPESDDWSLVASQDLNDGSGPYSSVEFDSLDLNKLYWIKGRNLKGVAASGSPRMVCRVGAADNTTVAINSESDGTGITTALASASSAFAANNKTILYLDPTGAGSWDLLDNSDATMDDLWGHDFDLLIHLADQGTTDTQGIPFYCTHMGQAASGTSVRGAASTQYGGIRNATPSSQINGFRVYCATTSFAEVAGASLAIYRYDGSIFT